MRTRLMLLAFAFAVTASAAHARGESRYAGTYTTMRPGADSTQALLLILEPNGHATLTTTFPDLVRRYGPGVLPIRESGTWQTRGKSVHVRLTTSGLLRGAKVERVGPDRNVLGFVLRGCRLDAVRYSKAAYGEAGLRFYRAGCKI